MTFDFGISGKKYLVTGASSGIGQATAILISQCGGRVILTGRNKERLNQTLSQLEGEGHYIMPFDLADLDGIKPFVKNCIQIDGRRFDGMVFASGIAKNKPIRSETISGINEIMKVNFIAYLALLKEFSSQKNLNDGGAIVAVSSQAGIIPDKGQCAYGSSKAALEAASTVASRELEKRGIRVNLLLPGTTKTPMATAFFASATEDELRDLFPLGVILPEDIANAALFFLSNMSTKVTGQRLLVLGGHFVGPYNTL